MSPVSNITVTAREAGQKLINFLMRRLAEDVPKSALMRWIRTGQVRVDKGRAKPFDRLDQDSVVRLPPQARLREVADDVEPGSGPVSCTVPDIVHSDQQILVLNKPAGLPVHGGTRIRDSLAACLAAQYEGYAFTPTLAHRLDRDTSGLIMAALSYETLRSLQEMFSSRVVTKIYLAWVAGRWEPEGVTILRDRLAKRRGQGFERVVAQEDEGKPAETRALSLVSSEEKSLLALRLITGRTHQIRAQLALRGHPILGDRKYEGQEAERLFLHAWRLFLPDNALGPERSFVAEPGWTGALALPRPMSEAWWELLRGDDHS